MNKSNLWLALFLIFVTAGSIVLGRYMHGPDAVERELSLTSPSLVPAQVNSAQPAEASTSGNGAGSPTAKTPLEVPNNKRTFKLGLSVKDERAFRGYTLLASLATPKTYLIDLDGRVVREWEASTPPALSGFLLPNGNLLRPCGLEGKPHHLNGPGAGGRIQEFTWNGDLVWDFTFTSDTLLPHHDILRLPNGNVVFVAWDRKSSAEAIAAGRRDLPGDGHFMPDCLVEIKPTGESTGEVVWEWHAWDHLIQDYDRTKANFGDVAAHPERIDLNFGESPLAQMLTQRDGVEKLRSIGYLGSTSAKATPRNGSDWTHINSVAYDAQGDLIMLSVHAFSEIWIIDHATTTTEAAGSAGGKRGKGGDLVYRWGNPRSYRAGTPADQRLYFPHSAHWIPPGVPGAGHVLVFNNGARRPNGPYSSVDEIALPEAQAGQYLRDDNGRFGPLEPAWSYSAPNPIEFYSMFLSGAQRLPNGNTLICSGMSGTIFEVTPEKEVVWRYTCPIPAESSPGGPGTFGGMGPPGGSAVFRAHRYAPDYPGLANKKLEPQKTVEELHGKKPAS